MVRSGAGVNTGGWYTRPASGAARTRGDVRSRHDGATMSASHLHGIRSAEIVLPCDELTATLAFFRERLGFRLDAIQPADDPAVAQLSGHGMRVRLQRGAAGAPGALRLAAADPAAVAGGATVLTAPNGTRVEIVAADPPLELPPIRQSFVVNRVGGDGAWGVGRAGMGYRDLIPDRQGGRFIASHIRIPDGGPVPDMVHFHKVRFQMIYCYRGWVDLLYQDQGPLFRMTAGDCVLQPPEIRHRVVESSAGLEVIEIGCPAEHMTCIDHDLDLPNDTFRPDRDFGGQRFVRHRLDVATWRPWRFDGIDARDIGIAAATDGLAGAQVLRFAGTGSMPLHGHQAEFVFTFVLEGATTLEVEGHGSHALAAGDCYVVPNATAFGLTGCSGDLELLEVALPAGYEVAAREP